MDAKKAPQPTWETVRYMISCIQYGGRITDDFDQLLMDTYAEKYFHQGVLQVSQLSMLGAVGQPVGAGHYPVHSARLSSRWPSGLSDT